MAFGSLKKIAAALTGTKPQATARAKSDRPSGANAGGGRRRRGGRGRGKGGEGAGGAQGQGGSQKPAASTPSRQSASGEKPARSSQPKAARGERRGERSERGGRGGRGGRRGPAPVNTAANEMRPGGEVSAEELAARQAAHAAWSLESFVVEPMEGKRRFHDFDLPSEVMHGIADLGFKYCTEIQALSLEQALAGKNIAGKAQTGSGKTAAFLVAILTRYLRSPENRAKEGGAPRALVIAPTRELVIQICKDADAIGKYTGLRSLAIYGGMDYDRQRQEVLSAPVDLLVATPGRLLDFTKSRVINLSHVDTLVIDEADRMLDMGFIPDVPRIMR